jgi:hypothetical protein
MPDQLADFFRCEETADGWDLQLATVTWQGHAPELEWSTFRQWKTQPTKATSSKHATPPPATPATSAPAPVATNSPTPVTCTTLKPANPTPNATSASSTDPMILETFFDKFDQFADAPDAVAKMRTIVLELALQGKLVQQEPTDESAEELSTKIEQARVAMMGKGKGTKIKLVPPIAPDNHPYVLPAGWAWASLAACRT